MDVAPTQMIGVSAAVIPFLEHDDANRALMGSNMQRQAVPLLEAEPPIVGTGMERTIAHNTSMVVRSKRAGKVTQCDALKITVGNTVYPLQKYVGLNERTCNNQKPIVNLGDQVEAGQIIADGAATRLGELALGRNVLVGFMSFDGFNYEDAIIISEELVKNDAYTSIHIEEFDVEIRETKLGREEFTRDIPNVSDKMLAALDDSGIVQVGTYVTPGDILVGKVSPKSKTELTPEEKLLHAIFGRAGEDVKNDSLTAPSGIEGIVINTEKFSRRMSLSDFERKVFEKDLKAAELDGNTIVVGLFKDMITEMESSLNRKLSDEDGNPYTVNDDIKFLAEIAENFRINSVTDGMRSDDGIKAINKIYASHRDALQTAIDHRDRSLNSMKRGDELRSGVLQMVKIYIATKRTISVGDKMAGRHGNKGVISKIMPIEDMPYLEDGTPIQIMLNPLGVPSRMNVGQILETHLGWAGSKLGFQAITPVFDGATEEDINEVLAEAGLPSHGKSSLFDGRTGKRFEQETTVGYIYMLKLHHLVDEKVHARSTGPYSLITQQPLGGKARFGGQRFGEMEVWALEAYGAAYILQELLTVKSDDVEGRTKIYEAMVKGENTLEAGTPASFDVLTNEIRGLALNMELEKRRN
jgi:DNA-directed RNA polymerase subunit beta